MKGSDEACSCGDGRGLNDEAAGLSDARESGDAEGAKGVADGSKAMSERAGLPLSANGSASALNAGDVGASSDGPANATLRGASGGAR